MYRGLQGFSGKMWFTLTVYGECKVCLGFAMSALSCFSVALRPVAATAALSLAAFAAPASANGHGPAFMGHVHQGPVTVSLDHTELLRLPYPAAAVVVGNPEIADVAVHSTDTLLVLGRSYGSTNVIAMDASGRVIINQRISVGASERQGRIQVYEGAASRKTFDCQPSCLPSPELGDEAGFYGQGRPGGQAVTNPVAGPANGLPYNPGPVPVTGDAPAAPAPVSAPAASQPGLTTPPF